ncbi:MAG: acetyltransferase [Candidatus Berkiellales bacterium]
MNESKHIIILGAGGHASVLIELAISLKKSILGLVAPSDTTVRNYPQVKYLGSDDNFHQHFSPNEVNLVNGIGSISVEKNELRQHLFYHFKRMGYSFLTLVHPTAWVASSAQLGEGVQVMAGAIIQPNVHIADNVIINTKASVDHDCEIGHSVHIAPGATLSGGICVKERSFIGVGATLIQGLHIDTGSMIKAGSTIIADVMSKQ